MKKNQPIKFPMSLQYLIKTRAIIILLILTLSGCVLHYTGAPDDKTAKTLTPSQSGALHYKVGSADVLDLGGPEAIESALKSQNIFQETVEVYDEDIPNQGVFFLIEAKYQPPSLPAIVFGYLSVSTLTLLPAWSSKDGYDLIYKVYVDGKKAKTFHYEIRRFAGIWLFALPFIWVNLLTTGEEDVFKAVTYQFLEDVRPIFSRQK